jgi:hypothetical protein
VETLPFEWQGTITSTDGFDGALTGNVTGDVTGNVTGDLTGNADTATRADGVQLGVQYQLTAAQSHTTTAAWETVVWDDAIFNKDTSLFSFDTNGIRPQTSGLYVVEAGIRFDANATGSRRWVRIQVAGTTVAQAAQNYVNASIPSLVQTSKLVEITANEKITVDGLQDSGGALDMTSSELTWFSVYRV